MTDFDATRRHFLKLMITLPVALQIGCEPKLMEPDVSPVRLLQEESVKKLILLLGPWTAEEREAAEEFIRRFMASTHSSSYLSQTEDAIVSLAGRFPEDAMALEEIDLSGLTVKEREVLIRLTSQLYSFVEIRYLVSNEPPWGECQTDRTRYTRPPQLRGI